MRPAPSPGSGGGAFAPLDPAQAVSDLYRFIENPGTRFGTGWSVDDSCGMVGKGELALCVARSSSGKSTWMLNVVRNTPRVPTVVVNMEMQPRLMVRWLLPMTFDLQASAFEIEAVLRAGPEDDRWQELHDALNRIPEVYPNLHFVSPPRPQVEDLRYIVQDVEDATGIRPARLFIDHLKLMAGTEKGYEGYTALSANLKAFAAEEDLAVFVLQQTQRRDGGEANDGHLPVKFGSGVYGGEEDADWMFGIYRPDRDPKYRKPEHHFSDYGEYLEMRAKHEQVRGQTIFQVIKNRPFSETNEDGVTLIYNRHTMRLKEIS